MKYRILSLAAISVLLLNSFAFGASEVALKRSPRTAVNLLEILPDSDGIAIVDSKRFLEDSLPKVLAANEPMLTEVMSKIKAMETRTGIDLRKFNQVAVGVAFKHVSSSEVDYDAVAAATGDLNVQVVISSAKTAAKNPVREEKVGSRTIYIFTEAPAPLAGGPATSKVAAAIDKLVTGFGKKEIAVVAFDTNTLVIGSPARVRQTLGSGAKTDSDVRSLLPAANSAVITFAARTKGMLGKLLPLEADMLGDAVNSIQYLTGSMDVAAGTTSVQLMARTNKPEQATELKTTLEGLQIVGKAFLGASKRADQQVYSRMLSNAKFNSRGADLTLDLVVPQADIDVLIGGLK